MRIALFTDTYLPDVNGVVRSIDLLYRKLKGMGHTVYVVCTHKGLSEVEYDGDIIRLPGLHSKRLYGYNIAQPFHPLLTKELGKLNLDIIHAHTEFGVGIYARKCAKALHVPLVSTYHTAYEDYVHYVNPFHMEFIDKLGKKLVVTLSRKYADTSVRMISPSSKTKKMLTGYGIDADKIDIIPTGLDLERFRPENTSDETRERIREEVGIKEGYKQIVFVGRVAEEKGIDMVIDAFKIVDKDDFKVRFVIIGSGPAEEQLRQRVKDEGLEDYVVLIGKRPQSEIASYYNSANAFVSASTSETQGMTYIEALASGLMIFVRRDDVVIDLIKEGVTGYMFDNAEEIAKLLRHFNELSIDDLKANSKACIDMASAYDDDLFGEKVAGFYEKAIEQYKSEND